MRRIISIWFPYLPTDRVSQKNPEWNSESLVTCDNKYFVKNLQHAKDLSPNIKIISANHNAFVINGITPGSLLSDARARLKKIRILPAQSEEDIRMLKSIAKHCYAWTPKLSLNIRRNNIYPFCISYSLWLNISGCSQFFGGEELLIKSILEYFKYLKITAYVAIADTPGGAWAISRYGLVSYKNKKNKPKSSSRIIEPGGLHDALKELPIKALRLNESDCNTLNILGLYNINDIYNIPRSFFSNKLGNNLLQKLDQALGTKDEILLYHDDFSNHIIEKGFSDPIINKDNIYIIAKNLMKKLSHQLALEGKIIKKLEISLIGNNGDIDKCQLNIINPTQNYLYLAHLYRYQLDKLIIRFSVYNIFLEVISTELLNPLQFNLDKTDNLSLLENRCNYKNSKISKTSDLYDKNLSNTETIHLLEKLVEKLGVNNISRITLSESRTPENASTYRKFNLPESTLKTTVSIKSRPLQLLRKPEPIKAMNIGDNNQPIDFWWRSIFYKIIKSSGPERITSDWWLYDWTELHSNKQNSLRDYYQVENENGQRFWIYQYCSYRSHTDTSWWIHGLFS